MTPGALPFALMLAAAAGDPCALPAPERAPDPRCGEALDGRDPAEPSTARKVGQAALAAPRVATRAVFWPVVRAIDLVEYHHAIDWVRAALTTDDGLVGVRPEVQYSTSFAPTAGLRFFDRRLPGAGSELMLRARSGGPDILLGEVGARASDRVGLSLLARFDRRNDRLFAGSGPRSDAELAAAGRMPARYGSDNLAAELRWTRRLPLRLVASGFGDVQRRDYQATDVRNGPPVTAMFGADEMPGFARGVRLAHAGAGLELDLRDPARDGGGFSLEATATFARGIAGDPSRHALLTAESVAAIGGSDRVVLLRARAAMVERLSTAPIPFDALVIPSGLTDMRGFPTGRYRGESALVGSLEYRWYISMYFDATLFADVGTVAGPRFGGIDWERWLPSFGLGFRYYKTQGPYWQARARDGIQLAYAPEGGLRVLLTMAAF
jgi:hypothetical protein